MTTEIELKQPMCITSRLFPGIRIGATSEISIAVDRLKPDGRIQYRYWIDSLDSNNTGCKYYARDIQTRKHDYRSALSTLLSFMSAAAESYHYTLSGRKSDNADLFPKDVMEWCYINHFDIQMAQLELDGNGE